jgi:S-adenosylmethionine:tRNA ribosyltransferase-isomerase
MKEKIGNIRISEYEYSLPDASIAQFPLNERDRSRLLIVKGEEPSQDIFSNLSAYLPANSLLISNETRVVHARLQFRKPSGSAIEIFCLEPLHPTSDIQLAFQQQGSCTWKCLVGNARRWKSGALCLETSIDGETVSLDAVMDGRSESAFEVSFSWSPARLPFSVILEHFGKIPLPPYISRESSGDDEIRYQTVFARNEGSVAAPTAGLHFTPAVLETLREKGIDTDTVTLHVGAGTFKPVSTETIGEHHMHHEQVIVPAALIRKIRDRKDDFITLVGTTTVRTLESVYWQGVKWLRSEPSGTVMNISQWDPYEEETEISLAESLDCILTVLERFGQTELRGETSLMIAPGYRYRIPSALITNFHQPGSTLLLLVSAFAGERWKDAYTYALRENFRFLSYGDSCLFFKNQEIR